MKTLLLVLALGVLAVQTEPFPHMPCIGALKAMAQESQLPKDVWCQRAVPDMPKKAVACACHQHDCTDPDPDHVSAHTDPKCGKYCDVHGCKCGQMDCP